MKLVICEKNISARNIAYILSGGNVKNIRIGKTPVYDFKKDDEIWNVIGLRGHIISLDYPSKFKWWKEDNLKELINEEPCRFVSEKDIAFSLKNGYTIEYWRTKLCLKQIIIHPINNREYCLSGCNSFI